MSEEVPQTAKELRAFIRREFASLREEEREVGVIQQRTPKQVKDQQDKDEWEEVNRLMNEVV